MRVKVFDKIENKIMIPFLLLILIPIFAVGIASMWSTAQNHKQLVLKEAEEHLKNAVNTMEVLNGLVIAGTLEKDEAQDIALDLFAADNRLVIKDIQGEASVGEGYTDLGNETSHYSINRYIYKTFMPWGWQVGTQVHVNWFSDTLMDIQKHSLLIAVIAAILTVQATVVLAYNISKPIKKIVNACNIIDMENIQEMVEEENELRNLNRNDEIGLLSESFSNMLMRLRENNKKIVEFKTYLEAILQSTNMGNLTWLASNDDFMINRKGKEILSLNGKIDAEDRRGNVILQHVLALCREVYEKKCESKEENSFSVQDENIILELNVSPLLDGNGKILGATSSFQDITPRKKIEEQMERLERLVFLGEMAASIAHEIRNPLAGMKTCAQIIGRNYELDAEGRDLILRIVNETDRINGLIIDMLKLSTSPVLEMQSFDLNKAVEEVMNLMDKQIRDKGIPLTMNLYDGLPLVHADKNHIKQILLNLLINAVDVAERAIKVETLFDKNRVSLSIQDDGLGIPKENLKKIFNPFYTTKNEGTGMGLAVVLKLANLNECQMEVISDFPGGGSKFILHLNVSPEDRLSI